VALLAYLAATRRSGFLRRDALLPLLWPDLDQTQGRHALRNTLHSLRKTLGPECVTNRGRDEITLANDVLWLDAEAFEGAVSEGRHEDAVALYAGDFLSGFHVSNVAPDFEHWMDRERDRLARGYTKALEHIAKVRGERGDHRGAADAWRRLVAREPLSERLVLHLMESLAAAGERGAALGEADSHIERMRTEYDADPAPLVLSLARELRTHEDAAHVQADESADPGVRAPDQRPTRTGIQPSPGVSSPPVASAEPPLVGRAHEWQRLQAAWQRAADGRAGMVAIQGVPGIGKTRLAEEQLGCTARRGIPHARCRCYAGEARLAYGPVAEWLRSSVMNTTLRDLEPVWLTEVARVLPELQAELPDLPPPKPLTESWQRRQFLEALARGVLAAPEPLFLLIDDLQWCDAETLEWLRFLMHFAPDAALLVVGTVRSEEVGREHPWNRLKLALQESSQLTEVALGSLDHTDTAALAGHVAERDLSADQIHRVFQETEGNPLFVVEAVRAGLLEAAPHPGAFAYGSSASLPPRVQAVIEFRLSQLSAPARELAALAATLGRRFTMDVLAEAGVCDEHELPGALDELWQRRIVQGHGTGTYDFSHDKLREVAYAEIGPARRRFLHRRAARALEATSAPRLDELSSQLAVHYELAGLLEDAIAYYERAAGVARRTYGDEEAIGLLTRALRLLEYLPESTAREERELRLVVALGVSAVAARGWAAQEAGEAFARGSTLGCELGKRSPEFVTAVWGLHAFYGVRGDVRKAVEVSGPLWELAEHDGRPEARVASQFNRAFSHFHCGELSDAERILEDLVANPHFQDRPPALMGFPLGVLTHCYRAHVLWHLGHADRALESMRSARSLAEDRADPFERSMALAYESMLHQFCDDPDASRSCAESALALCDRYGISYYGAWVSILRGWALGAQGEPERGIDAIQHGLSDLRRSGAELRRPYYLGLTAGLYARLGDSETGIATVSEALAIAREKGERWCEPELLRLDGELLTLKDAQSEAEDRFRQAIRLARQQGARAVEARASASLNGGASPARA
jgi:DNA-binding SARP family transcriptional activator/tetratricopeptide (TPR) repeat protein